MAAAATSCSSGLVRRAGRPEQAQHPGREASLPQRQRLVLVHHAQPLRAAGQRRVRRGNHAVPVAVGFDHRHHRCAADVLAHRLDVAGDGGQIDERFRVTVHGLPVCQYAGSGPSRS
jgi:hypothetical protein